MDMSLNAYGSQNSGSEYTTDDGKPTQVINSNDPEYLRQFIAEWGGNASATDYVKDRVALAEKKYAELMERGYTVDVNGDVVQIPQVQKELRKRARTETNLALTKQFAENAAKTYPSIDPALADIEKQIKLYQTVGGGALTEQKAAAAAMLKALGIEKFTPESWPEPGEVQSALKVAQTQLFEQLSKLPGGAPAAEMARLQQIMAEPNKEPEAIRMILAMQKAGWTRERDRINARQSEGWVEDIDQLKFNRVFDQQHPYQQYLDAAMKSIPLLAGETVKDTNPTGSGLTDDEWKRATPEQKESMRAALAEAERQRQMGSH
jgi:ribosome-associated translation inhibitor RaiA